MKRKTISLLVMIIAVGLIAGSILYSQPVDPAAGTKPSSNKGNDKTSFIQDDEAVATKELLGENTSKSLYRVVVDTFEEAGEWYATMPNDQGLITSRRVLGAPLALKKLGTEDVKTPPRVAKPPKYRKEDGAYEKDYYLPYSDQKKYVLGIRVDFQKRGNNWFAIYPYRPIPLEGVVKSLEVWVCGRNKAHELSVIVEDIHGQEKTISLGKLDFLGWKRMSVNIPDGIVQYDYRFNQKRGLVFKGFVVQCDPIQSYGKYYIYFDNLTAEVSRFWEEYQDQRDPLDTW